MSKKYQPLLITHYMSTWVTITEAVEITTKAIKQKITPSDIYRHALSCLLYTSLAALAIFTV